MTFTEAVVCCCHGARCELAQNNGYEVVPREMFCPEERIKYGGEKNRRGQNKKRVRDPKTSRSEDTSEAYESALPYDAAKSEKKRHNKRKYTMKNKNDIGCAVDLYLGALPSHKAERETRKRSTFKLYHKIASIGLEKLDHIAQLMICYRTSRGSYKHFPIRTRCRYDGKTLYYVEYNCDEETSMLFDSIEKLTRYYQAYPLIELNSNGDACIELFPV